MKNIENVVDFADICIFAESSGLAFYNAAIDILRKHAYPWPESPLREVYKSEIKYIEDPVAKEILTKYFESIGVDYITVTA
jgi:hypothetical protein